MITIEREMLWQWDYGQRVQLRDVPVGTKVHFSNAVTKQTALVTEAYEDGEGVYADIPNVLLQTAGTLTAYIYIEDGDEGHTEYRKLFIVRDREKPDDYVYTEDEVKTWEVLEERIKALEESGGSSDIPSTLPNPHPLTFTGAVEATYDGSTPVEVEIPSGGGGSENLNVRLVASVTIDPANPPESIIIDQDVDGNPFELKKVLIYSDLMSDVSYTSYVINDKS